MAFETLHVMSDNPLFRHVDIKSNKEYPLYNIIAEIHKHLVEKSLSTGTAEYSKLLSKLESVMLLESLVIKEEHIRYSVAIFLNEIVLKDTSNKNLLNLKKLFWGMKTIGTMLYQSRRITTLKSLEEPKDYAGIFKEPDSVLSIPDLTYNRKYNIDMLELVNLTPPKEQFSQEDTLKHIKELDKSTPLKSITRWNLIRYRTTENLELRVHTLVKGIELDNSDIENLYDFTEAAEYFLVKHKEYQTFNNYIDVPSLVKQFNHILEGCMYIRNYIDASQIKPLKDPKAYYPSGQEELYALMSKFEKCAKDIGIVLSLVQLFYGLSRVGKEISKCIVLPNKPNNPRNWLEWYTKVKDCAIALGNSSEIIKQTTGHTNPIVEIGQGSKDISKTVTTIEATMSEYRNELDTRNQMMENISENILVDYETIETLIESEEDNSIFFLIQALLQELSELLTKIMCAIKQGLCYLLYLQSVKSLISEVSSAVKMKDPSEYLRANLSLSGELGILSASSTDLFANHGNVVAGLGSMSDKLKGQFKRASENAISQVDSSGVASQITGIVDTVYNQARSLAKSDPACEFRPGIRGIDLDMNLRYNLEIPDMDFNIKLGGC